MDFENDLASRLTTAGLISPEQQEKIVDTNNSKLFSLNFELRTLLYCGVVLLTTGLGIVIYKNIDTIGHDVLIGLVTLLCTACFVYCFRNRRPYSNHCVESPSAFFDYILLSACLLFLILEGYLQFQYNIFGERYGLATVIPAILFFALAYLFDHKGVLSMGITALCAWIGITVTPLDLLSQNDLSGDNFIYAALLVGVTFIAIEVLSNHYDVKAHFRFTYLNFAAHLLFVASLSGIISTSLNLLYLLVLGVLVFYFIRHARREKSFYFLLIAVIYGYIGFTWELFHLLYMAGLDLGLTMLGFLYFIGSCIMIIKFLKGYKKILKTDDPLQ